jgi:hypothetical protein
MQTDSVLNEDQIFIKPAHMVMIIKSADKETINIKIHDVTNNERKSEQLDLNSRIIFNAGNVISVFIESKMIDILLVQEKFYLSTKRVIH